jgi:two-component system, chemotaxis family, sensor kinase CheA
VLKTRMQPVANLFTRFPRMVRDLARQMGKQAEIHFQGQEVELDKSVLEQLSDPLTHLIRNSIDHGIELPDVRAAKGKPTAGRIVVAATAGDGQVHIKIKDDGRGLDPAAIRAKALSLGLKSEDELQKLSPKELASLILLPGFSTAAKVTDVSGRGVGMDVVKTNIERLEGSLNIDSEFGIGTTILLRVPLTLAIIPCLIVHVGRERIAIPQRAIEEIVCIYPGGDTLIESTHNAEYLRLRESLVSVARMNEVMARPKPFDESTRAEIVAAYAQQRQHMENLIQYLLVLNASGRRYGLLVDEVKGTEEVVVKPMHPSLKQVTIFSGATVMGDGKVALIASAEGIASHTGCSLPKDVPVLTSFRDPIEVHRVLLFEYGPAERFALPLIQIRRIEAVKRASVEYVGKQQFVNVAGISTRLVFLDELLSVSGCDLGEEFYLIIPKFVVEPMGIVASRIVDTDSMSIDLQEASVADPGILGTALIQGRLSIFLDVQFLRDKTFTYHLGETLQKKRMMSSPDDNEEIEANGSQKVAAHVLLIDDTPFFREIVRRYLESQGMTIVTAVDGIDGLKKCASENFDLIVSDIEMPNMNGWEFCSAVRKQGYEGPMIALTSLSKSENERQAKDCGFDTFEEKLDHDSLIKTVKRTLRSRRPRPTGSSQGVGR